MFKLLALLLPLLASPSWAEPPPGHPSAEQAIGLLGVPDNSGIAAQDLPYLGTVLSAMDSNAFTFIEVKEDQAVSPRWIAAPRITLVAGDRIRFDDGRLMRNFHSRKLDITFAAISFVNRAVREEKGQTGSTEAHRPNTSAKPVP